MYVEGGGELCGELTVVTSILPGTNLPALQLILPMLQLICQSSLCNKCITFKTSSCSCLALLESIRFTEHMYVVGGGEQHGELIVVTSILPGTNLIALQLILATLQLICPRFNSHYLRSATNLPALQLTIFTFSN